MRAAGSPLRRGQVLVAGDAAGLLEPWSREGISFALRSGRLAGRAAVTDVAAYDGWVERDLGPEMALGRRALQVFSRYPGAVHTALRRLPVDVAAVRRRGQGLSSARTASPCSSSSGAFRRTPGSGQAESFTGLPGTGTPSACTTICRAADCSEPTASATELIGPHGTPAASSRASQSAAVPVVSDRLEQDLQLDPVRVPVRVGA